MSQLPDTALGGLLGGMLVGLLIVGVAMGTWLLLFMIPHIGDVPFAIICGVVWSLHRRTREAQGERKLRAPQARIR